MDKRTCTQCGAQFQPKRTASKCCSTQCYERSRRPNIEQPELFRCHGCGVFVCRPVRKRGQVPKWCAPCGGETAGPVGVVTRKCEHCDRSFECTAGSVQRFCSHRCSNRPIIRSTELVHLGSKLRVRPTIHQVPRRWFAFFTSGSCRRCGAPFTAPSALNGTPAAYCGLRCLGRDGKDRRRARKRDAYVEDVSPTKVFERDAWRCQICGKPTAKTKVAPHPKAPTLDHIIPLAAGGRHEPANAQCAHFICNSIKGDRSANDQLRLLG